MAKDASIELDRDVLDSLAQAYGGNLTLASFTRMVTDGTRINAPEPIREAPPPPTKENILLTRIAKQLIGKKWESEIKKSSNALDLAQNLKKLGITVKSDELRIPFNEMGMKNLIEEIKRLQAPPKKRNQ